MYFGQGRTPVMEIHASGFKADGEVTDTVDLFDTYFDWYPNCFGVIVERLTGTTNTVSVKLQGTIYESSGVWDDLITITDVTGDWSAHDWFPTYDYSAGNKEPPLRCYHKIRVLCTTVGTGNTLHVHTHGAQVTG